MLIYRVKIVLARTKRKTMASRIRYGRAKFSDPNNVEISYSKSLVIL